MNKQQFLNNFINSPKPKDTTSAIPFLAKHLEIARKNNITFSKEEINEIYNELSKDLPEKNRRQVEKILKSLN